MKGKTKFYSLRERGITSSALCKQGRSILNLLTKFIFKGSIATLLVVGVVIMALLQGCSSTVPGKQEGHEDISPLDAEGVKALYRN
ncbi:MAG: hypothetical protein ACP5PT_03365 [Brevinematia bacterium]